MARRTARNTQRRKTKFLEAYKVVGTASEAARITGIPRDTHREWLKKSETYRQAFADADDAATEVLEKEALRRAVEGREEDVYFNGVPVGKVRKYSDVLLIFLMKAKRPDVYRERYDVRTQGNLNIQSAVKVIHEYHDGQPAIEAIAKELEPNSRMLTAQVPDAELAPEPPDDDTPEQ
jgi:hypothetical protein